MKQKRPKHTPQQYAHRGQLPFSPCVIVWARETNFGRCCRTGLSHSEMASSGRGLRVTGMFKVSVRWTKLFTKLSYYCRIKIQREGNFELVSVALGSG